MALRLNAGLLQKQLTRKEFLGVTALGVAAIFGVSGLIKRMSSFAASDFIAAEPEKAVITAPATVLADSTASAGSAVSFAAGQTTGDLITRARFGAFAFNEPYPTQPHFDLENTLGHTLPIHSWFQNWSSSWNGGEADKVKAAGGNRTIMICWEPSGITLQNIANGQYDTYITTFITAAKAYGGPVVLRPMHEMNGSWYDWAPGSGRATAGSAATYIAAWQRMVRVARATGATNVKFFWCANGNDANNNGTTAEACYPGSDWVDIIGFDAYSWSYEGFRAFDDVMTPMYNRVTALHPSAPVWIGETSVDRTGHSSFYTQAYTSQKFPRMKAICWFSSGPDTSGNDFRIAATAADIAAHKAQLPRMASA